MNTIELQSMVGGALQEKFERSFERVIDNLQDADTPYKKPREINIKMKFAQNEARDDVVVDIVISEKLAPQGGIKTAFAMGRDLKTGDVYAEEYGKQIKGQMSLKDFEEPATVDEQIVDTETGEILDFRKAAR